MQTVSGILIPLSSTFSITFPLEDSATDVGLLSGITPTCLVSKNGGAFSAATNAASEMATTSGVYTLTLTTSETNTTGPLTVKVTGTGANPTVVCCHVVALQLNDAVRAGLTALPNANAGANGGLATCDASNAIKVQSGTGANQISLSSGLVTAGTVNDKTGYRMSATGVADVVDGVWNALVASYSSAGTFGKRVADFLIDIWDVAVPGAYASGKAGHTLGTNIDTTVSSRSSLSIANVTTGVNNALDAANTELASVPTTTGTLRTMLQFLFQYFRNRRTVTSSVETLYKEDASTSLGTSAISDNGTTFDKGEMN